MQAPPELRLRCSEEDGRIWHKGSICSASSVTVGLCRACVSDREGAPLSMDGTSNDPRKIHGKHMRHMEKLQVNERMLIHLTATGASISGSVEACPGLASGFKYHGEAGELQWAHLTNMFRLCQPQLPFALRNHVAASSATVGFCRA